ncbi:hypothetical protein MWG54_30725 (plasmid) [Bacillus cereus]|uniref:hypothetical protein n=1 Tax=Bacillus cereus TaxID=1396 RepID=UPI001FF2EBF8|nr:hypothetical protein [Bacillus cereus]UOX99291.1 hypothetical protein MWG54_30725 [Bacillus cereus]
MIHSDEANIKGIKISDEFISFRQGVIQLEKGDEYLVQDKILKEPNYHEFVFEASNYYEAFEKSIYEKVVLTATVLTKTNELISGDFICVGYTRSFSDGIHEYSFKQLQ